MDNVKSVAYALFLLGFAGQAMGFGFTCAAEGKSCQALVGFKTQERTNLSAITTLFQLSSYRSLLGVNGWDPSLPASATLPRGYILRVPIGCSCKDGTGTSRSKPVYTVQKDNTLSLIANDIFAGLVKYQDIAKANDIPDPNKILVGQKLHIPLPCSCDGTNTNGSSNSSVVHFAYVVQAGNSLAGIASSFGCTEAELVTLNSLTNASSPLLAGQVIDVPLAACSSTTSKHWSDGNLLVANGSYAITASRCVQCSCGPRDLDLYCAPATLGISCPSMQCENSNLTIGNFTTQKTSAGCSVTTCSYSGYKNGKILTSLSSSVQSECPAKHVLPSLTRPSSTTLPPPPPGISTPGKAPSPGSPGAIGTAPASGPSGHKSAAAGSLTLLSGSLRWFSLPIMLISGLPFLIHFGDW